MSMLILRESVEISIKILHFWYGSNDTSTDFRENRHASNSRFLLISIGELKSCNVCMKALSINMNYAIIYVMTLDIT